MPPTRCRTHLSSPPRSWAGCVTPSGCGPGSSPWRGTSACAGSSPGAPQRCSLDLPEQPDESVDVGGEAERAESRALIRAAVGGLNDGERDVINQLWHGLEIPEVAMVLGVSRNHAHSLFSRARDQLEASVGVLVVGRSGRKDCAALDQLLHGWDGRLTAPLRRRVGRHIDRCSVCSDRRRRELRPAALLSVAPGALVGFALAGGGGPGRAVLAPAGLRADVLHLAADHGARAVAYRAAVGHGTRSFQLNGFPQPAARRPPRAGAGRAPAAERGRRDRRGGDRDRGGAGGRAACATPRAAASGPATARRPARRRGAASAGPAPRWRAADGVAARQPASRAGDVADRHRHRRPARAGGTTSAPPPDQAPTAGNAEAVRPQPRPRRS